MDCPGAYYSMARDFRRLACRRRHPCLRYVAVSDSSLRACMHASIRSALDFECRAQIDIFILFGDTSLKLLAPIQGLRILRRRSAGRSVGQPSGRFLKVNAQGERTIRFHCVRSGPVVNYGLFRRSGSRKVGWAAECRASAPYGPTVQNVVRTRAGSLTGGLAAGRFSLMECKSDRYLEFGGEEQGREKGGEARDRGGTRKEADGASTDRSSGILGQESRANLSPS